MNKRVLILQILKRCSRRKSSQEYKPFESSSIADLAFLLLIFFIVTGSFILRQGIFFSLPAPDAGAMRIESKLIMKLYPQNSGYLYNGSLMDREKIKDLLLKRKSVNPKTVLLIMMKKSVRYDRFVDALSMARETGIDRVSLKEIDGG